MGLDRDDEIVRRRLAQKMEFLAADLAIVADPPDSALREYYLRESGRWSVAGNRGWHLTRPPGVGDPVGNTELRDHLQTSAPSRKGRFMRFSRSVPLMITALCVSGAGILEAQARPTPRAPLSKIELTGYAGYQFGLSSLTFINGDKLDIKDNVNYGGSIGLRVKPQQFIEFSVNRLDSDLRRRGFQPSSVRIGVTNFYLGGFQEIPQGNVRPFFGFNVGATWYSPKEGGLDDDWRFSVGLGGGAKIMFGEAQRVGLRLQGNLLMTFLSTSWGGYCGTGGCGLGLFGTGVADLNFTAGLTVALGDYWN